MQINLNKINWSRVIISFLVIVILLLISKNCNNSNSSQIVADYEAKKQVYITQIAESNNIIDSIKFENSKLEYENDSIISNKNIVVKEKTKYIETIKYLNIDGQQGYFTQNYKALPKPLKFVKLDSLQAFNVITDIETGKTSKYEVGELNKVIFNNNKQIGNYKMQIEEFDKIQENYEAVVEDCEKSLYEAQKQVKFRLLIGGGIGMSKELNQGLIKANLGFQNKKGNVAFASYMRLNNIGYILGEYNFSIFTLKGK
jgi:hypothetical protein